MNTTALFVEIITATRDADAPPVRTNRINFNSEHARKWLASHTRWALQTGHTIHMATVQEG